MPPTPATGKLPPEVSTTLRASWTEDTLGEFASHCQAELGDDDHARRVSLRARVEDRLTIGVLLFTVLRELARQRDLTDREQAAEVSGWFAWWLRPCNAANELINHLCAERYPVRAEIRDAFLAAWKDASTLAIHPDRAERAWQQAQVRSGRVIEPGT